MKILKIEIAQHCGCATITFDGKDDPEMKEIQIELSSRTVLEIQQEVARQIRDDAGKYADDCYKKTREIEEKK